MANPNSPTPSSFHLSARNIFHLLIRIILILLILAGLLFVPAGRTDWMEAWVFIFAYGVFVIVYALWSLWKDPAQMRERRHTASNTKSWDKVILAGYTVCLLLVFILAGMDAGRIQWSKVPRAIEGLGWMGQLAAGGMIFWAVVTNTYLSRVARIQEDRGQVVVASGPYQYVRHPMYIGIIILFLSIPLSLGSWWALIPGFGIGFLFLLRTSKEDQMLRAELDGYEEYSKRVRYRLIPGIW